MFDSGPRFTAVTSERSDYETWFTASGGSISGNSIPMEGARAFFVQSGLSNDILSHVWRLANRANLPNGALNFADFCIAANLLLQLARRSIEQLPQSLPLSFYDSADGFARINSTSKPTPVDHFSSASTLTDPVKIHTTGASTVSRNILDSSLPSNSATIRQSTVSPVEVQRTGSSVAPSHRNDILHSTLPTTLSPSRPSHIPLSRPSIISEQTTGTPNDVTMKYLPNDTEWAVPTDKQALYSTYFTQLDVGNKGFATGSECFNMFIKSGLSNEDLSKIWSLVAVENQLRLDDFIVAMYLIFEKRAGKPIPDSLPSNLIPPSRRSTSTTVSSDWSQSSAPGITGTFTANNILKPNPSSMSLASASISGKSGPVSPAFSSTLTSVSPSLPKSVNASFDDIIGGNNVGSSLGGLPSLESQYAPSTAIGSTDNKGVFPASAPLTLSSFNAASFSAKPNGSSLLPTSGLLSNTAMSSLPAAALSEAKELNDLIAKTETLSMHRIEATTSLNHVSIERQNLQIRLDQTRVTHDAEERMLKQMKDALHIETKAVDDLKDQILNAENQRVEMSREKQQLSEQIRADQAEAEQLRNKLVSINQEIARMRAEINELREKAKRGHAARDDVFQTVQNVEDARVLVSSTLENERRQSLFTREISRDLNPGCSASLTPPVTNALPFDNSPMRAPFGGTVSSTVVSPSSRLSPNDSVSVNVPMGSPNSTKAVKSPHSEPFHLSGTSPVLSSTMTSQYPDVNATSAPSLGTRPWTPPLAADTLVVGTPTNLTHMANIKSVEATLESFPSPSKLPNFSSIGETVGSPSSKPLSLLSDPLDISEIPDDLKKKFDEEFTFDFPKPDSNPIGPSIQNTLMSNNSKSINFMAAAAIPGASGFNSPGNNSPSSVPGTATLPGNPAEDFDPFAFASGVSTSGPLSATPIWTSAPVTPSSVAAPNNNSLDLFSVFGHSNSPSNVIQPPVKEESGSAGSMVDEFDPFAAFQSTTISSIISATPAPPASSILPTSQKSPPTQPEVRTSSPISGGDPIAIVTSMGFSREQAIAALEQYDFDPEKAINYLIDKSVK